jgi:hypothetical protein
MGINKAAVATACLDTSQVYGKTVQEKLLLQTTPQQTDHIKDCEKCSRKLLAMRRVWSMLKQPL